MSNDTDDLWRLRILCLFRPPESAARALHVPFPPFSASDSEDGVMSLRLQTRVMPPYSDAISLTEPLIRPTDVTPKRFFLS